METGMAWGKILMLLSNDIHNSQKRGVMFC